MTIIYYTLSAVAFTGFITCFALVYSIVDDLRRSEG